MSSSALACLLPTADLGALPHERGEPAAQAQGLPARCGACRTPMHAARPLHACPTPPPCMPNTPSSSPLCLQSRAP
jgi:hypothetical protein